MDQYLGQIMAFAFNFAPRGWAECAGQLLPIAQNQSLFSLLGTIYGGDGRTTFALPDLRGRTPLHTGEGPTLSNRVLGSRGGEETVSFFFLFHAKNILRRGDGRGKDPTQIHCPEEEAVKFRSY